MSECFRYKELIYAVKHYINSAVYYCHPDCSFDSILVDAKDILLNNESSSS